MNRILLFTLLVLGLNANAQIEKKTMMVGGSLRFNSHFSSNGGLAYSTFQVNPNVGYFLANNFALGLGVSVITHGKGTNFVYFSPFARYYCKNFYIQSRFDFARYQSQNNANLNFDVGYALFLNKNIALEPAIYFNHNFNHQGNDLGFKMGLQIYFNRK